MIDNEEEYYKDKDKEYRDYARNKLWEGRNFEISHFWYRLAFLATFLVLAFSGYAKFLTDCFSLQENVIDMQIVHHAIFIVLTTIGSMLSVLWILMAKGSKFWYEVYEQKIKKYEESEKHNQDFTTLYDEEIYKIVEVEEKLFCNTKACRYSVSGVTIAMGQIFVIIWAVLLIVHIAFCFYSEVGNFSAMRDFDKAVWFVLLFGPIIILSIFTSGVKSSLKSKTQ